MERYSMEKYTIDDYKKVKLVFKSNRVQKKISTIYKIEN